MGIGGLLGKSTTTYSDEEILSSSVKSQLGLGADAVPSDAFALLGQSMASSTRIVTGSYTGIYDNDIPSTNHQKINLGYEPKIVFILDTNVSIGFIIINCDYVQNLSVFDVDVPTRGFGRQFNTTNSVYLATYNEGFVVCSDDANSINHNYYYSAII